MFVFFVIIQRGNFLKRHRACSCAPFSYKLPRLSQNLPHGSPPTLVALCGPDVTFPTTPGPLYALFPRPRSLRGGSASSAYLGTTQVSTVSHCGENGWRGLNWEPRRQVGTAQLLCIETQLHGRIFIPENRWISQSSLFYSLCFTPFSMSPIAFTLSTPSKRKLRLWIPLHMLQESKQRPGKIWWKRQRKTEKSALFRGAKGSESSWSRVGEIAAQLEESKTERRTSSCFNFKTLIWKPVLWLHQGPRVTRQPLGWAATRQEFAKRSWTGLAVNQFWGVAFTFHAHQHFNSLSFFSNDKVWVITLFYLHINVSYKRTDCFTN